MEVWTWRLWRGVFGELIPYHDGDDERNVFSPRFMSLRCLGYEEADRVHPLRTPINLNDVFHFLQASGWYWGNISAHHADCVLTNAANGTFLVRDSAHTHYLFTLSLKTAHGPTNVRIEHSRSCFRLSSSPAYSYRSFPTVSALVQHYAISSRQEGGAKPEENILFINDGTCALELKQPLYMPNAFPTLQHLARLTVNRHAQLAAQASLPHLLQRYLEEYPFQV